MTKRIFSLKTFMRKGSARVLGATDSYCHLGDNEPLLLELDPGNQEDASAVMVKNLTGEPVGYVAREHAALVAAQIKAGVLVLCRTNGPCLCFARKLYVWADAEEAEDKTKAKKERALETMGDFGPAGYGPRGWGNQE